MKPYPIVIMLVETSRDCGRDILLGVVKYARVHGPWTFFKSPPYYTGQGKTDQLADIVKKSGANGMVVCAGTQNAKTLKRTGLPCITVDVQETVDGLINIMGDCDTIGKISASHFLEKGYKNFAFCGYDDIHWSRERRDSFIAEIKKAGFNAYVHAPATRQRNNWITEQTMIAKWLKTLPLPLALMACNDDMAQKIMDSCKVAGLRVPDDIAVLGVDNDEMICLITDPPLSSIEMNFEKAGFEAAQKLDLLMKGKRLKDEDLNVIAKPVYIAARQSTDILAVADKDISEALRFIRRNIKDQIGVDDVVRVTAKSRRVLEYTFKNILGRSIMKEIRRTRVAYICSMLTETDLTVNQIAHALNYKDAPHISRYFSNEMKMSPLEYRKAFGKK